MERVREKEARGGRERAGQGEREEGRRGLRLHDARRGHVQAHIRRHRQQLRRRHHLRTQRTSQSESIRVHTNQRFGEARHLLLCSPHLGVPRAIRVTALCSAPSHPSHSSKPRDIRVTAFSSASRCLQREQARRNLINPNVVSASRAC